MKRLLVKGLETFHPDHCLCSDCTRYYWGQRPPPDAEFKKTHDRAMIMERFRLARLDEDMASIMLCSRPGCDAMMTSDASGTFSIMKTPSDQWTTEDLCPECVGELVAWYATPTVSRAGKAFKKPYQELAYNADITTDDLILKAAEKIILSDRKAIDS